MAAEEEVEQQLVEAVSQEVALELSTPSGNSANKFRCCFCPFRSCGRADRLGKHIRKFHAKERLFTANGRTQAQWNLVLAMFEQEQATGFKVLECMQSTYNQLRSGFRKNLNDPSIDSRL